MPIAMTQEQQALDDAVDNAEDCIQVLAGPDRWEALAQAGLLSVGDDGLGVLEVAVLLTEIGRRASPDSLKALATLMTGALPVVRWGDADLQQAAAAGRSHQPALPVLLRQRVVRRRRGAARAAAPARS